MPRKREPARLYLSPKERVWLIRDGAYTERTGFNEGERRSAEEALANYVNARFKPAVREGSPANLSVAEVLSAYLKEHAPTTGDPARIAYAVDALAPFWGEKRLTDIRGATCREYIALRTQSPRANMAGAKTEARRERTVSEGTVRRELGTLSAAIGFWHREHGPLDAVPVVTLPPKPEPKPDVLTRSELARLLAGALGWYRISWSDIATRRAGGVWQRDRTAINRHTARFLIIGRYTANRPGTTLGLHWMANTVGGWPEIDREIMFRRGQGKAETNKRQPSVRLGRAVLAHLRRWKAIDERARDEAARAAGGSVATHMRIVNWNGREVKDIGKSFATALHFAGLPARYTPHILRHTRVTWWVEAGLPIEEVADAAGMTVEMVEKVYWHRSPNFQKRAAEA
jgi:integrase